MAQFERNGASGRILTDSPVQSFPKQVSVATQMTREVQILHGGQMFQQPAQGQLG